jgi:uncharacterized integral membrane protein
VSRIVGQGERVLRKLITALIGFPVAVVLVAIAVTNRHQVKLALDPFSAEPLIALELPFYVYLIASLILGVILGGVATWLSQGRMRRHARVHMVEARRWRLEADRLSRERDQRVIGKGPQDAAAQAKARDAA